MLQIGPYKLTGKAFLAPMAGVTDKPFRDICRQLGAAMTTSEMVSSEAGLRDSQKTKERLIFSEDDNLRSVQIVGSDPEKLADAARFNVENGAHIIDINMGCPAKKVCSVAAGSALMRDEKLVEKILHRVVNAVDVPVTLKTRTGWDLENKNGVSVATIAENAGISAIAVHGRTRACMYTGEAEYETIAKIKSQISIPVIVNGDITSAEKAKEILTFTNADAVMIGRGAQGNPWIFREINAYLETGLFIEAATKAERQNVLTDHIKKLYQFYGEYRGVRIARKHINWYCNMLEGYISFRKKMNQIDNADDQLAVVYDFFHQSKMEGEKAA
ncbi:MAG: tRNA dihydrouridine synthase DusB [Gammaproteobacteria bacterium]|nr:tRNA dihydrouridine synthase DusB [Gammaproteobacteria bacterium]